MKQETICEKCTHKAEFKLVDKWYCTRCFTELVEQKIRHNLRRYDIKKDSTILARDKICELVLKTVINMPVKIVTDKQKTDYIALPWTLDDENEEFLKTFFERISKKDDKRIIRLFYPLSKDDVKAYCQLKKIAYHPEKTEINEILDTFDKKYPGTKTSILRSGETLSKLR